MSRSLLLRESALHRFDSETMTRPDMDGHLWGVEVARQLEGEILRRHVPGEHLHLHVADATTVVPRGLHSLTVVVNPVVPVGHESTLAPTLTPLDTPVFDEDVIADMEKRLDTPPSCEARERCERPATVVLRHRCCGLSELVCGPCLAESREHVATHPTAVFWCLVCRVQFAPPVSFDDMIAVVPL